MDAVKVIALTPSDANEALSVGRKVEFHGVAGRSLERGSASKRREVKPSTRNRTPPQA
jgi:hypothetical protein